VNTLNKIIDMDNNITGTITGTADATGILGVVAQASNQGFLHIMLFVLVMGIMAYIYLDRKERSKSKDKNEAWQDSHMELHNNMDKYYENQFKRIDENFVKMFDSLASFGKRLGDISDKVSELSGSFKTFISFEKDKEKRSH